MNSTTWWSEPTDRVLLEQRRVVRVLDVLLDRHQAFLARLLQDVVEQRHQLHVARLRVLRALQHARQRGERRLEHLRLVVDDEGAERAAEDGHQLRRQRVDDHADVAAVQDVGTEDAAERHGVTDENEHVLRSMARAVPRHARVALDIGRTAAHLSVARPGRRDPPNWPGFPRLTASRRDSRRPCKRKRAPKGPIKTHACAGGDKQENR